MLIDSLLNIPPFSLNDANKIEKLVPAFGEMAAWHYERNKPFKKLCDKNEFNPYTPEFNLEDIPFFPVNIFKKFNLSSIPKEEISKTVLSSATTSGIPSKITIDAKTSRRQTKASTSVISDFLGKQRRPFMIFDIDPRKTNNRDITARSAATRGFLMLANKMQYFLEEQGINLRLNLDPFIYSVNQFIKNNQDFTVFGFTYVIYMYVIKPLLDQGYSFDLSSCKLAHIGGWKKLIDQSVSPLKFKKDIHQTLGILPKNIIDFYGFTEQMGIIYGEGEDGFKHVPVFAEVFIRDFDTLEPVKDGEIGLIQTISPIFSSFPGISVITEDVGRIVHRGKSHSGKYGTGFEIIGRAKDAELRGCGDLLTNVVVG